MRLSARKFAAMLMGLALAAFQPDMDAQSRSGSRSSSRSTSSVSRSSSTSRSSSSVSRPSSSTTRQQAKSVTRPDNKPKPDISPADRKPSRPAGNKPSMERPAAGKPVVKPEHKPKPDKPKPGNPKPDFKPGNQHKPIGVRPPAARPPHTHRTPVYRPVKPKKPYVRPIVIRPSYGSMIAADVAARMAWTAVNIAYFNTVARTYDQINNNSATIAQQNAVIAQNNATIAAQNQAIAASQVKAEQAYGLANGLGLVQNYADAGVSYFYQDGVFYTQGTDGQYYVIVPPAGALVETLPEDFETVTLNGTEYFKVDNTIYQLVINEGKPYFEVVGQTN